jgi:hypothetical protein
MTMSCKDCEIKMLRINELESALGIDHYEDPKERIKELTEETETLRALVISQRKEIQALSEKVKSLL